MKLFVRKIFLALLVVISIQLIPSSAHADFTWNECGRSKLACLLNFINQEVDCATRHGTMHFYDNGTACIYDGSGSSGT